MILPFKHIVQLCRCAIHQIVGFAKCILIMEAFRYDPGMIPANSIVNVKAKPLLRFCRFVHFSKLPS